MGSGKTTIAKKISSRTQIPLYQTDNFVWDRSELNKKYPAQVRDELLINTTIEDSWIIEGAHYQWGFESFEQADVIFILIPNVFIRDWRMVKRFIKTRLGLEESNYRQTVSNLIKLIELNHKYEMDKVFEITEIYASKRIVLKNSKHIFKYI